MISNIATQLGVSPDEIKIVDTKDNLVMINPVEATNADVVTVPGIRGSVWELIDANFGKTMKPVYGSLGFSLEYVADQIVVRDGKLFLTNSFDGNVVILETKVSKITVSNEGIIYRVTPDNYMKHDKMDATNSRWGRAHYSTIFTSLGLPSKEEIYKDSPRDVSHVFMACHKHCVTGSRQVFKDDFGYIVYFGAVDANSRLVPEKALKFPEMRYEDFPSVVDRNLGVINAVELTVEQANDFLRTGFYDEARVNDVRLRTGESIIIHTESGERIKVLSSSFHWRNQVRNSNPSVPHQYYSLVFEEWNSDLFAKSYLNLDPGSVGKLREFISNGGVFVWAEERPWDSEYLNVLSTSVYERARVIYFNMLLALPPADQNEYSNLYDEFVKSTEKLLDFLHAYRENKLFFVDPSKLPVVGTLKEENGKTYLIFEGKKNEYSVPPGKVYKKGVDAKVYDITNVQVEKGKQLVVLPSAHPGVNRIVTHVVNFTMNEVKRMGRVSDKMYKDLLTKNFRFLLSKERFNTRYQMTKQCEAWVR